MIKETNKCIVIARVHFHADHGYNIHCRYKNYEFISDQEISKSAGLNSRYTENSLHGVVFDIQILSESDYLVCTFSSQVM